MGVGAGVGLGELDGGTGLGEEGVVEVSQIAAAGVGCGEPAEFDLEDGCLDAVEAGVPADVAFAEGGIVDLFVEVAAAHAVVAKGAGAFG